MTQLDQDKYRFGAERYSLRGSNASRPSEYVPQLPGMYAFPLEENMPEESSSSSSLSSQETQPKSRSLPAANDGTYQKSSFLPF